MSQAYEAGAFHSAFRPMTPKDFRRIVVTAQCLDNQWVPNSILRRLIRERTSRKVIARELEKLVRAEYVRSLVNAEQVIINRAYIKNNPAVFGDFIADAPDRPVFKELLGSGVIVPFLYSESSPVEEGDFDLDDVGNVAWRQLCQEVEPLCLRLSWDKEENERLIKRICPSSFTGSPRPSLNLAPSPCQP